MAAQEVLSAREAWLAERVTYIGATDASAVLGVNPYTSAHDVWLQKKGLATVEETLPMRMGTYLEEFIAKEYARVSPNLLSMGPSRLYRHPKCPMFASNPDREIEVQFGGKTYQGLLECKSVGHFAAQNFGSDGSDQVPEHYMVQCMWQLITSGKDLVHLAALIDNRELRVFTYTLKPELSPVAHVFDADLVKTSMRVCAEFWRNYIEANVEPPMTGHESDTEYLQKERPNYDNGLLTNTDEDADRDCRLIPKALIREKRAKYVVAERKNRIKAFMASRGASDLESSVGLFTWRTNKNGCATFKTPFKTDRA